MNDNPRSIVARLGGQVLLARCVAMAAELGFADLVAEEPQTPDALAAKCGVHPDALMRILRFLAGNGIFRADAAGAIHNTEASDVLRSGVPGSLRDMVRQSWQDVIWDTYRHLPHTLRTGEPAFKAAFGLEFFDYLAAHPEIGSRFDASMARMSAPENAAIAAAYDFGTGTIVDVGGGRGGLLAAVLETNPTTQGILYDQAAVLADPARLLTAPFDARCTLIAGDFFKSVPPNDGVYLLKRILHDWSDAQATQILATCRAALTGSSRILVIDAVIAPGNDPDPNKLLDVGIMALLHGRERTAEDFARLFAAAGLVITRILPPTPPSTLSLIEGHRRPS